MMGDRLVVLLHAHRNYVDARDGLGRENFQDTVNGYEDYGCSDAHFVSRVEMYKT